MILMVLSVGLTSMAVAPHECDEGDWSTNFVRYDGFLEATYIVQSCGSSIRLVTEFDCGVTEFDDIDVITAIYISNLPQ